MRYLWTVTLFCSLAACKTLNHGEEPPARSLIGQPVGALLTLKGRPLRTHNPRAGIEIYEYVETSISMADGTTPVTYSTLYREEGEFSRSECVALYEIKDGIVDKVTREGAGCPAEGT